MQKSSQSFGNLFVDFIISLDTKMLIIVVIDALLRSFEPQDRK